MDWTEDQKKAIFEKDNNILVAAAAGSGKTAVLVERIIQKILNDGVDIDKLLVVTFTNAAASEMRERVLEAIYKKLDDDPDNENLQRQIILLGKSNICTMHSFCLNVIRNNFFEIDIPATFRIGGEQETMLLKVETLEDLFEDLYESNDEDFEKLVNTYTDYRSDDSLKELVLDIYKFIQSMPFPKEWLKENIDKFARSDKNTDFAQSIWGKVIVENYKAEVISGINTIKALRDRVEMVDELEKYKQALENDLITLRGLYDAMNKTWDGIVSYVQTISFDDSPKVKTDIALKTEIQKARTNAINKFKNTKSGILREMFSYDSESIYEDLYAMHDILDLLGKLVIKFDERFAASKKEKNIVDFNDIEHFALKILSKPDVAKKYKDKFEEIAIDEYQDSNQVQEYIINLISRGNNVFMVGDVKQSIYKFRQACPKLFLEKYNNYSLEGNEKGEKIKLFKNFRSKENVLDITNLVFENIMSSSLGDNVEYTEEEYLNLGANYEILKNGLDNAEIDIIDLQDGENDSYSSNYNDYGDENEYDDFDDKLEGMPGVLDKTEVEAKYVAKKIKELIDSKVIVCDKKGPREIMYKDIVILLRSTKKPAAIFEKELINNDIPVFSDGVNEYLDTIEIQTMINILRMLDNPLDDISLVSSMRSIIGDFGDNEILEIRLLDRNCSFYDSLKMASEKLSGKIKDKVDLFLNNIENWKKESDYITLAELIWKIYSETGFYNYVGLMPNGSLRQANLKLLFEIAKDYEKTSFAGIYNFIKYVERLKMEDSDMSSAKIIGENEDVVRIMSIHKSKGLEFPIVFLSNASKQMNFMDLNSKVILHEELGFGPDYINYETMQEYPIIAKEAVKIQSKEEAIAEEMRILYVALTRAKEKLIITGTTKDYEKEIEKKKEALHSDISSIKKEAKIAPILLKKYKTYLDWLELVYLKNESVIKEKNIMTINVIKLNDVMKSEDGEQEKEVRKFDFDKYTDFDDLEKKFSWKYQWQDATVMPIKTTVSKIKEQTSIEDFKKLHLINNIEIDYSDIPDFMMDENVSEKITGARRGTITHMILQNIDFKAPNSIESLEKIKDKMLACRAITETEYKSINLSSIINFIKSDIGQEISSCKDIEKEKPFCINLKLGDESVLVQGIIDLYAIKENGEIILVDYKTDFVQDESELRQKYAKQLELYKFALENNYNQKVSEVYIYSLYLQKAIKL